MPGLVTSIDVAPPIRTENSGMSASSVTLSIFRLLKSGSQCFFSSRGASWPRADIVTWLPRSSITCPHTFGLLRPFNPRALSRELTIFSFSSTVRSSE